MSLKHKFKCRELAWAGATESQNIGKKRQMNHEATNCVKRSKQPVCKAPTTRKSMLVGCSGVFRVTHVTLPCRVTLTHGNLTFEGGNPLIHRAFYEWAHSTKWDPSSTWMTASRSKHEKIRGRIKKTEIMVLFCRFNKSSKYFHKGTLLT